MKPVIRLYFTDFWSNFNPEDNYFTNLLLQEYTIIIDDKNPDYLIYSCYGNHFLNYPKSIKIFYAGENVRPSYHQCNYSITFDYNSYNNRNFRLPLYILYGYDSNLINPKKSEQFIKEKHKFCNFLVSNSLCKTRNEFFKILNSKKNVDSGGRYLNNIGKEIENKLEFIKDYRFTIAFENTCQPGYTTEKIFEPMKVNSIPIYWGNKLIYREFNTKSFINVHDFSTLNECANYIVELDSNKQKLTSIIEEPWFLNNELPEHFNNEKLLGFFNSIFSNSQHKKISSWQAKISYNMKNSRINKAIKHRIFEEWKYIKTVKFGSI